MIYVEIIDTGEIREIEKLEGDNWCWLADGNCRVTFATDGAVGLVISEEEADNKKMNNWLRPDEKVDKEPIKKLAEWI